MPVQAYHRRLALTHAWGFARGPDRRIVTTQRRFRPLESHGHPPLLHLGPGLELLPWLRSQFAAIADSSERLAELQQQIDDLAHHRQRNGHSNSAASCTKKRQEARQITGDVQAVLTTIERRGILVRDVNRGLVDFPARREDGQEIHLCWLKNEDTVGFWHLPNAGFASRQPI